MFQSNDRRMERHAPAHALLIAALAIFTVLARPSSAQTRTAGPTVLHGAITTQNGAVFLPGVVVTVIDAKSGATIGEATSDDTGKYQVANLPPGTYTVRAFLEGFAEALKQSV